jgi:Tol biopolymer transport system component
MAEGACQPDWSPDGKRLVFISPCSRNQELYPGASLYLVNLESKDVTPLTTGPGGDFDPAWSPDGKKIAFTSMRNSGRPRIYVINLEDGSFDVLSEQFSRDSQPAWSPDGKEIAFVSSRKGLSQIWIMDADGSNQRLFSQSGAKNNWYPHWSLDGQTILFTQIDATRQIPTLATASYIEQIYNEFQYQMGPIPAREGRYSPDGFWVVFESWPEAGNHDIYIMAAGGAIRTQLTTSTRPDFDPVWKPLLP